MAGLSAVASAALTVTGTYVGTAGSGTFVSTGGTVNGSGGSAAYRTLQTDSPSGFVINATMTGGNGASVVGTDPNVNYNAGGGGAGLELRSGNAPVTINGGTYTGGNGGNASGTGKSFFPGIAGNGLLAIQSNATINGGTFRSGTSGSAAGFTAGDPASIQIFQSTVTLNGGAFGGVSSTSGSVTKIYGGTFDGFGIDSGSASIYGYDFKLDGVSIGNGPLTALSGTLSGRLPNNGGAVTSFPIGQAFSGAITIVPEPTSVAALALGALLVRRRK